MRVRNLRQVQGERGDAPASCCCEGCEEGAGAVTAEVPVYSPAGKLLTFVPPEWCERHAPHLRLVRSKRGALKRAMLRCDDGDLTAFLEATGRRSNFGAAFEQHLPCGRVVWALKGVRGSGR